MRVTANSGTALNTALFARRPVYKKTDEPPAASTSLIVRPVAAVSAPATAMSARPLAAFLAQLIAKAQDLPVSRVRRRADPAEGASVYRAVAGLARQNESKKVRVV